MKMNYENYDYYKNTTIPWLEILTKSLSISPHHYFSGPPNVKAVSSTCLYDDGIGHGMPCAVILNKPFQG